MTSGKQESSLYKSGKTGFGQNVLTPLFFIGVFILTPLVTYYFHHFQFDVWGENTGIMFPFVIGFIFSVLLSAFIVVVRDVYKRWRKRQINLLEEIILLIPIIIASVIMIVFRSELNIPLVALVILLSYIISTILFLSALGLLWLFTYISFKGK